MISARSSGVWGISTGCTSHYFTLARVAAPSCRVQTQGSTRNGPAEHQLDFTILRQIHVTTRLAKKYQRAGCEPDIAGRCGCCTGNRGSPYRLYSFFQLFFLQAEDGIRDGQIESGTLLTAPAAGESAF